MTMLMQKNRAQIAADRSRRAAEADIDHAFVPRPGRHFVRLLLMACGSQVLHANLRWISLSEGQRAKAQPKCC